MNIKPLPSQKLLHILLRYEAETGKLYWKPRASKLFRNGAQSKEWNANIWNGKNAGKEAFQTPLKTGHLYASIFRRKLLAHRVIWKMTYGTEPDVIDHDDGNPANNLLSNLNSVGQTINTRNARMSKNNTSGFNGVTRWRDKWQAKICFNRKTIHLGCFDDIRDAVKSREDANLKYGFHANHGRSALS